MSKSVLGIKNLGEILSLMTLAVFIASPATALWENEIIHTGGYCPRRKTAAYKATCKLEQSPSLHTV